MCEYMQRLYAFITMKFSKAYIVQHKYYLHALHTTAHECVYSHACTRSRALAVHVFNGVVLNVVLETSQIQG